MVKPGMIIELWMDDQAEEAARFYVDVFKDSELGPIRRYVIDTPSGKPVGSVITADFTLNGQRFQALNGGAEFNHFTEAVSFIVECEDQAETDYYWEQLSYVPEAEACGWCKDKFGMSWQIVPKGLDDILNQADEAKAKRAWNAILEMKKIDLAAIKAAAEQA